MSEPAPLFVDTMRLSTWLLHHVGTAPPPLARQLAADVILLLDQVTLSLQERDRRPARVTSALERLSLLRVHLRLAAELGLLDQRQLVFILEECDGIGRQLGGWARRLTREGDPLA